MAQTTSDSEPEPFNRHKIDVARLKRFAIESLPTGSPLREILLSESDELDVGTFLARLPVFLRLAKLEGRESRM